LSSILLKAMYILIPNSWQIKCFLKGAKLFLNWFLSKNDYPCWNHICRQL